MTTRRTDKSEQTLSAIANTAYDLAKRLGIQAVSLTNVARELGISKGGVALRVGSVEALRNLVLDQHEAKFRKQVFDLAMDADPGLPRLDCMVRSWMHFGIELNTLLGSLYAMCTFEVEDEHQALRTRMIEGFVLWQHTLERTIRQAIHMKHLRPDTDPEQLVFEIFGLMMAFMYQQRLSRSQHTRERAEAAYARLIWPYRSVVN